MDNRNPVMEKICKLLLRNAVLGAFTVYLLAVLCFCNGFSWKWLTSLLIVCFLGWIVSFFYNKYEEDGEMYSEEDYGDDEDFEVQGWRDRWSRFKREMFSMSGWSVLRWLIVISFLATACYIMHESLSSLWLNEEGLAGVFCWFLSVIIITTLFLITGWLTYNLPYVKDKYKIQFVVYCVGLYVLFDLAAFTFNYFHIYSNFGETQIMAQVIKNSEEMTKYLAPKISAKIADVKNMEDSINQVNKKIDDRISKLQEDKEELDSVFNNGIIPYKIKDKNGFVTTNPVWNEKNRN